jgi:chorismate mutase
MKIKPFTQWNTGIETTPAIIAGPCSAETESQVLNTAAELNKLGIKIFRAGIWKPRTRPNAFEGVGSKGFKWLSRVKEETGMLIATEVANVKHVYEALKANIDILWIGARSSANPFSMQEIADVLKGMDIMVLVKNPINPDIDLWQGAIERLQKAGLTRIGAIHRGVSSYNESIYRNVPQWQIPIELSRRIPGISIFCDPSHIGGKRELIQPISQKAMDLNFDGLMIETHIDPDNAWSDAQQQITPKALEALLKNLVLREVHPDGISYETLERLRFMIDDFDHQLLEIIKKRMDVVKDIGHYKKANNMTILQPDRWDQVLNKSIAMSKKALLSDDMVLKIFTAIHEESINKQTSILNGK